MDTRDTVGYLRCSSDSQETLRQREDIQRLDLEIDRWLEDHQSRDKAEKRPDFQKLLRSIEAGQVKTVVVQSLDRFGVKGAWELGHFLSIFQKHDCRLLDATGKCLSANDDATVLTSTIGALTSSREQREKAARVLTGKMTLAKKGQFLGGRGTYGCDIVAFNVEGKEVWRVVYEGHEKRVKIYPDGRQERFDGKRNRPPKALHETLRYRPSIIAERVKYVKLIFKWWVTEAISAGQIAARLNELGISPVFGPLWHSAVIKYLLSNRVYIGKPTYNKASTSRFAEFSGGRVTEAKRGVSRQHAEADQIEPEKDEFKPMVPVEMFEQAQAKLAATKTREYAAPKTASLWLRGLVICAQCGKPMIGQAGSPKNGLEPGYLCAEYGRWGTKAPTGCGHFRVEHVHLEAAVLDYLVEEAPQVKMLLEAATATDLESARPLLEAIKATTRDRQWASFEMQMFVTDNMATESRRQARKKGLAIEEIYDKVYPAKKKEIEARIAAKEGEIEALLDGFAGLTPKLRERANRRGEALQDEIEASRLELKNWGVHWGRLTSQLKTHKDALARATTTLNQEGHHRAKAAAIRTVIGEIICTFKPGRPATLETLKIVAVKSGGAADQPQPFCRLSSPKNTLKSTLVDDCRQGAKARE